MTTEENFDNLLSAILQNEENIFGFFDRIFEFLYRKTDFFKLRGVDSNDLGLESGQAEKIVKSVFCKYMKQAEEERQHIKKNEAFPLDCVAEEVVSTTVTDPEEVSASNSTKKAAQKKKASTAEEQGPVACRMDSDSYNGASYEDYSWSQSIKDIDVHIKVPCGVQCGKQVRVSLTQTTFRAELGEEGGEWSTLKEGEFLKPINVEGSTWTLVPREHIHVYLRKLQGGWWSSLLLRGESSIDLRSVDPSIPWEELDPDSRCKIRELMHEEHHKCITKASKPQNLKLESILKEAWDKEGSPFQGQPFDPSILGPYDS